jgi:Ala-tRNA(Pro) deacylase
MAASREDLFARLAELGIETETHEHPPLHTVEESKALRGELPGGHIKNLFIRDKNKKLWLIVAEEDRAVDLKAMRRRLGAAKSISFGAPELLEEVLGVQPGAVTPFGLINDTEGRVTVILDEELLANEIVNCHPLVNTATTAIRSTDLVDFVRACGHEPGIMKLDEIANEDPGS